MMDINSRSTQPSIEIPILTQWWAGPIVTGIMAILIFALYFINPTFKEMEGFDLFIAIFVILEVIGCGIPLLRFVVENGGPSRFAEAVMPYMPKRSIIAYTVFFCFVGAIIIAAIVGTILILNDTI
ncbi:MAG: hypothetical protein ACTSWW_08805 [Promethearchaeota archaeon]